MTDWRKKRNYRPVRDENGKVVGGVLTVDGKEVEVSREVYLAYSQADRRDRYVEEQYESGTLISLESLQENHIPLDRICADIMPSAEDILLSKYDNEQLRSILIPVLNGLSEQDKELIQALYFDGVSERVYAKKVGIYLNAVQYRRKKVIDEIRRTIFK